jgi:hypothetical protein
MMRGGPLRYRLAGFSISAPPSLRRSVSPCGAWADSARVGGARRVIDAHAGEIGAEALLDIAAQCRRKRLAAVAQHFTHGDVAGGVLQG